MHMIHLCLCNPCGDTTSWHHILDARNTHAVHRLRYRVHVATLDEHIFDMRVLARVLLTLYSANIQTTTIVGQTCKKLTGLADCRRYY